MAEITRTYYNAETEGHRPSASDFLKLDADNLVGAINEALAYMAKCAGNNPENYNACCLQISQEGDFFFNGMCYKNTVFTTRKGKLAYYCLTVPIGAIPAQAWPLTLMEFCGYYGIKISTVNWSNESDQPVPPMWDIVKIAQVQDVAQRALSYLADLNGSEWIKGDGVGETDMRQRAKSLQELLYRVLNSK